MKHVRERSNACTCSLKSEFERQSMHTRTSLIRFHFCGRQQAFLRLPEFPGYSRVRASLVRFISTLVPYKCHVFCDVGGRRLVVRRREIAFFSHCWDLPRHQVRLCYSRCAPMISGVILWHQERYSYCRSIYALESTAWRLKEVDGNYGSPKCAEHASGAVNKRLIFRSRRKVDRRQVRQSHVLLVFLMNK